MKHFTLSAFGPIAGRYYGDVPLICAKVDWLRPHGKHESIFGPQSSWASLTVGLLGFVVRIAYWPRGKA